MAEQDESPLADPNVQEALRDGRDYRDILLLNCPRCGWLSYYHQGSGFCCRNCGASYYVCAEDEAPLDGPCIMACDTDFITLDDVLECAEPYYRD
jgi:hypothetical protein